MSKKDKTKKKYPAADAEAGKQPILSKKGWKIAGIGLSLVIAGFVVLSFTDPRGQNFASHLSPFLIIGGYVVIGVGIVAKDSSAPPS